MILRRMIGAAVGVLILGGVGAAVATSPVQATGRCPIVTHINDDGVTLTGTASIELVGSGVVVSTSDNPAKAKWAKTLAAPVKMSAVTALSYQTHKLDGVGGVPAGNDAALPAYHVVLDVDDDGDADSTLVFEPYYQIVGNPARGTTQTWNVLEGKFWTPTAIPGLPAEGGGSYAGNKTWAHISAANPEARVVGFGWGQGTYNAGTVARLNHVKFAAKGVCQVHDWKKGTEPSPSPSQSVSPSPFVTPSTTASASASPSATETSEPGGVAGGDEPSLPVTGASLPVVISGALALLAIGGVLLLVTRMRRRTRFSA
jgi:hypothetical protein